MLRAPAHRARDLGSNPGPSEDFSLNWLSDSFGWLSLLECQRVELETQVRILAQARIFLLIGPVIRLGGSFAANHSLSHFLISSHELKCYSAST